MCCLTPTETMWVGNHSKAGEQETAFMAPMKGALNTSLQKKCMKFTVMSHPHLDKWDTVQYLYLCT